MLGERRTLADPVAYERQQFLLGRCCTGLELDIGDGKFARVGVWAAHGRGDLHRGMAMELLLDCRRIDIVAAADDQVLLAAGEPEVALRIAAPQIAGIEPALAVA